MSETGTDDAEIVAILGRLFPSLAALDPAEGLRRAEAIGLYAASIWSAGPQAMGARGVAVEPEIHAAVAQPAMAAAAARAGGTSLLAFLRGTIGDDARFAAILQAIATLYAQVTRAQSSSSATHAALQSGPQTGRLAAAPLATQPPPAPAQQPPAAPAPPAEAPPSGETTSAGKVTLREIHGFELLKLLGEGGMGKVFKAKQRSLDRIVALKVLSPQLAQDPEYVDRFHREAMSAAQLKHPNVVGVIEHGTDPQNGVHFIAFEFLDGMSVESMLKAKKKFPEREALAISRAVASALATAERAGIVHRDIKPDNVLVGRDGVPRLIDLGLAKKQEDRTQMTIVGVIMGTPQYMAPEQALGEKEIDHRADIYALGMTLYRLVTGQFAFDAESSTGILMKHITDECPDPRKAEPTVSDGTTKIILKASARAKEARYQSAAEFVKDVDAVLAGRQPPIASASPGTSGEAPRASVSGAVAAVGRASGARPLAAAPGAGPAIPETRVPDEPQWKCELYPPSIKDAVPPKLETTRDAAANAVALYERTGDLEALAEARRQLEPRCGAGKDVKDAALAETMLARALLLAGDKFGAEARARTAIDKDWRKVEAAEVLVRAARNDGERCRLRAALAQVREAVAAGKLDDAATAVSMLSSDPTFGSDPQPLLAEAVVAKLQGNESGFVEAVKAAWARFPSPERSDVWLAGLDGMAADMLVAHGRAAFKDAQLARSTIERLEDKSNLVAGSLRMAIGIARVALACEKPGLFEQRRLGFAVARALTGLRRYDAALEELQKAAQLNPTDAERAAFDAERSFTKDAKLRDEVARVPLPTGKYRCPATVHLLELAKKRGAASAKEKQSNIAQMEKLGSELMKTARADPAVKSQLRMAAEQLGENDPFETVEPIEKELASVLVERARSEKSKDESSSEKKGFLGKLTAAAAGVAGAAKDAALKVKEGQLKTKHEAALKAFAVQFGMKLRDFDYTNAKIVALIKRAALPGCLASVHAREETRAQKDVERLTTLI